VKKRGKKRGGAHPITAVAPLALDEEAIANHLQKYVGPITCVSHALLGGLHVFCMGPVDNERQFWTLVTVGLSGHAMPVPTQIPKPERPEYERCELMAYLLPNWKPPVAACGDWGVDTWPLAMLRAVAAYVVSSNSFICESHGFPYIRDEQKPLTDGSLLRGLLLVEPVTESDGFSLLHIGSKYVRFLVVVPLTDD